MIEEMKGKKRHTERERESEMNRESPLSVSLSQGGGRNKIKRM